MNNKFKSGNIFQCSAAWDWKVESMQDHDIWLVCEGTGKLESENQTYNITEGDCFVFPPGSSHYATHSPESPLKVIAVHFDIASGAKEFQYHRKLKKTDFVRELLRRSIDSTESNRADFWLCAALQEILDVDAEPGEIAKNYYAPLINDICRQIDKAPQKKYNIKQMASKNGICRDHFTRIFKELKGLSPKGYILNARIAQAKAMLLESSMSTSSISDELGYSSVYFFSKQFKLRTGQSPRQFKNY